MNIKSASSVIKETITEFNKVSLEKQKIDDTLKNTKKLASEIQKNLDYLKHISIANEIESDTIHNTVDEMSYLLSSISDSIECNFNKRKESIEKKLTSITCTLKTFSEAYGILKSINSNSTCPICLTNSIEVYIQNCGHSTCAECMSKTTFCYFCRVRIDKVQKIYML